MLLSQSKPSRNFTLIELLVVIAILGLLISILLPSLVKARHSSYQAVCMSNQKQLYSATISYTSENNSALMPCKPSFDSIGRAYESTLPIYNYILRNVRTMKFPAANHGILYRDGYIDTGEIFYCPGLNAAGDHWRGDSNTYKKISPTGLYPMPELFRSKRGYPKVVRGSYFFNPYGNIKTYTSILEYDSSLIMFTDILFENTISHGELGKKWVVVRGDGAAKGVTSESTYSIVFSSGLNDTWSDYDRALDELTDAL